MKYPLGEGRVGIVREDHGLAHKCYKDNLNLKRRVVITEEESDHKVNVIDID